MEKSFKHIAFLVIAVLICCNSLVANVAKQVKIDTPFHTVAAFHLQSLHSSIDKESGYSQNHPSVTPFLLDELLPENDEDETEHFATTKIPARNYVTSFYHQQQLQLNLPVAKSCTSALHPIFFQSKTASSLYLIFEVFRI